MKRVLFYFFFFPIFLSAQINESDTLDFQANLSFTGTLQEGNVDALIFRVKSGLSYKLLDKWVFKTQNSYIYQEFGKQKADEDILSLNFLYYDTEKPIYPLLLGFVSTNYRRAIDLRYLLGIGATFRVFEEKEYWLKFSLTLEYEETEFTRTTFNYTEFNGIRSIDTFRGTIWVNGIYHLFKDKMILSHESYFQPSLDDGNNFRWRADLGVELPIWEFLSFKINYLQAFESIVIAGEKQSDRFLTFGITLKSY